ncbi:hypothetical protein H0H93_010551, partial [Arthromyces matolae]
LAFIVYWGILLFGYDTGVAGGVVAQPYFQREFGLVNDDGTKNTERTNEVSSIVVSVLQAGAFFGALSSASISAKFGRRLTLLAFTLVFSLGAVLATSAHDRAHYGLELIYAGRAISGFGIGGISAVAPAFVSECAPKEVRGKITGIFQVMGAAGVMISYFINYGISLYDVQGPNVWRIPFGLQLIPAGIMLLGLLTVRESPRFLYSIGRTTAALHTLSYLRNEPPSSELVRHEMAEVEAQAEEESDARLGRTFLDALWTPGEGLRFAIAFSIFLLQQWGGQNSVGYYGPQIFQSIGFNGTTNSLFASGVYGVVKLLATVVFVFYLVEPLGRRLPLLISSFGMGILFFGIGTILRTYPPVTPFSTSIYSDSSTTTAAKAMAGLLYIYDGVLFRGSMSQKSSQQDPDIMDLRQQVHLNGFGHLHLLDFVTAKATPYLITSLGYGVFFLFGTINIIAMGAFALRLTSGAHSFLPETKGRSLEDMDIIFGAVSAEERARHVSAREERGDISTGESEQPIESDDLGASETTPLLHP